MDNKKVLLVSFPKSGSNWVRYCIEHFSGMRTPGSLRHPIVQTGPTIIDRTHFIDKRHRRELAPGRRDPAAGDPAAGDGSVQGVAWFQRWPKKFRNELRIRNIIRNRRLILLIRSHYESFARTRLRRPEGMIGYLGNIKVFDVCRQDKIIVYYEDLIQDFGEITRILDFIGIEYDLDSFDLDHHRRKSYEAYSKNPNDPKTRDDPYNFSFHSRHVTEEMKASLRAYAVSYLGGDVYERYLSRFDLPDESGLPSGAKVSAAG